MALNPSAVAQEFLTAAVFGWLVGGATLPFRFSEVGSGEHVLACGVVLGFLSIVLRAPNNLLGLVALVLLPIAYFQNPQVQFVWYCVFVVAASYLAWIVFELGRHQYRIVTDPEYRENYERHRRGD